MDNYISGVKSGRYVNRGKKRKWNKKESEDNIKEISGEWRRKIKIKIWGIEWNKSWRIWISEKSDRCKKRGGWRKEGWERRRK